MILNKVILQGYKRFENSSICFDRKLVSIIGPNEAGKSSLFDALLSLENGDAYSASEITKGVQKNDKDKIVESQYIIEKDEKEYLKSVKGIGNPRFYILWKNKSGGKRIHNIIGEIKRDKSERKNFAKILKNLNDKKSLQKFLQENYYQIEIESDEDEETQYRKIVLKDLIHQLLEQINLEKETIENSVFEIVDKIYEIFTEIENPKSKTIQTIKDKILQSITNFKEVELKEHPKNLFLNYLGKKRPRFVIFKDGDRFIKGSYSLEELQENPPNSITNLMSLAEVSIEDVLEAIENEDTSERFRLQTNANDNLKEAYTSSWSQSKVYPQIIFDLDSFKIQIFYSDSFTEISQRSEGLKQYIALKAFLNYSQTKKPILLIDEAEIHLHYSAQADLITEFEKQELVDSIIYSTHSAGCLPSDLGTGIRVIEPIFEDRKDTGRSIIRNSIWQNTGGFSPILLAMGANVLAFTPARKALIAEGPSETILLPRILREGNNCDYLEFQVAPEIANISKDDAGKFEFEAGKVIYIVDGDEGGKKNKSKLTKGGIDENKIISLNENQTLEDFIKLEILISAINRELENSDLPILESNNLKGIPDVGKISWIENRCQKRKIKFPSKVKIAENIIKEQSDNLIISTSSIRQLKDIFKKITRLLDK